MQVIAEIHSTAIGLYPMCSLLILSDDGTIINQDFCTDINIWEGRACYVVLMGRVSVTISYSIPLSDNRNRKIY